jgi:isoleucyl-tRNA synthetase
MYDMFLGLAQLLAPFTPFIAEELYQHMKTTEMKESVHLCNYPQCDASALDADLEQGMQNIRNLVEMGRALRSKIGVKVRYPLAKAILVCSKKTEDSIHLLIDLFKEELNVKEVVYRRNADPFMIKLIKPNYSVLGPRLKEKSVKVTAILESMDEHTLYQELTGKGVFLLNVDNEEIELSLNDFEVIDKEKEDIVRTETDDIILLLDTKITDELKAEGFSREIVRRIQSMRKELDLKVEQEIQTSIQLSNDNKMMLQSWLNYLKEETRSKTVSFQGRVTGSLVKTWKIDEEQITIAISTMN